MEDESNGSTPIGSRPSSRCSIVSEYGTPVKEVKTGVENGMYDRMNMQEIELQRLETQNAEYREKLLKTIRERDLNEELLKNVQNQHKKELDSKSKRIQDLEIQLKATTDKATAQEAHFNVTSREMSTKYNNSVQQLTKKADLSEKEKNEAVVKYAMREGEMMRLQNEIHAKNVELEKCGKELEECRKSQQQDNLNDLEKTINNLKVEIEKRKHENFDLENRMKIAEKRVETLSANLEEAKQQCDVLRKQLIQAKDDKHIAQQLELRLTSENSEKEQLQKTIRELSGDIERMKVSQLEMATKCEESTRENSDLLTKIDLLQDQLTLEEDRRKLCEAQVERLRGVEMFVTSSSERVEEAERCRDAAEHDRQQAETEARECREHAEKILELNRELTERNTRMQRELAVEKERFADEIRRLEAEIERLKAQNCETREENERIRQSVERKSVESTEKLEEKKEESTEEADTLEEYRNRLEELENRRKEEQTNHLAYKKKASASIKELKAELAAIRKLQNTDEPSPHVLAPPVSSDSVPSMSSRSRASSITSIDRVTSISRDDVESSAVEEAARAEKQQQQTMQQIMIDKIVLLQRKLARRTEKCEFLEEHVRQCLEELQKKTKIIQHFALREEASLLMPSEGSLEKVPIVRNGSAYALMGAMFTGSSDKKQVQVMSEINSRLQAVLEDVLQKNIAMRSSVDSLSSENNRLNRENRLLTLSQARLQDQQNESRNGSID